MVARQRTRKLLYATGTETVYNQDGSILSQTTLESPSMVETCEDHVEKGNGRPLFIDRRFQRNDGGLLTRPGKWPVIGFENFRLDALQGCTDSIIWGEATPPGIPSNSELAVKLLNATNPSRSIVDVPNLLWELKELPQLLRLQGNNLIKKGASANLSYQFGWRPLFSDLVKLLNFTSAVESRYKEIEALFESGLRRKRTLWTGANTASVSRYVKSYGYNTGWVTFHKSTNVKIWGFVCWYPTVVPPTPKEMRDLTMKAIAGWTVDPATVWNAIPWSWLVDWFSNVGGYLASRRNIIPARHTTCQIMRRTVTTISWNYVDPNVTPWSGGRVKKQRTSASPALSASMPILTGRQWSVLGSLGILRRKSG